MFQRRQTIAISHAWLFYHSSTDSCYETMHVYRYRAYWPFHIYIYLRSYISTISIIPGTNILVSPITRIERERDTSRIDSYRPSIIRQRIEKSHEFEESQSNREIDKDQELIVNVVEDANRFSIIQLTRHEMYIYTYTHAAGETV